MWLLQLLVFSCNCFQTVWSGLIRTYNKCDRCTSRLFNNRRAMSDSHYGNDNSFVNDVDLRHAYALLRLKSSFGRCNLWIVAVPAGRVFDDHALQIIPIVSHCTNTDDPEWQIRIAVFKTSRNCNENFYAGKVARFTKEKSDHKGSECQILEHPHRKSTAQSREIIV